MYDNILVFVDGPGAARAAREALAHLRRPGMLVLLSVVERADERAQTARVRRAYQGLSRLAGTLESGPRVECVPTVRIGRPAVEIAAAAEEFGAGVIVVGSPATGGLRGLFERNIAVDLLQATLRPVLVWRDRGRGRRDGMRRVLLALDGTSASLAVVPHATRLAGAPGAKVIGLYVGDETRGAARDVLEAAGRTVRSRGAMYVPTCRSGDPAETILRVCRDENVDMIAVASREGPRAWWTPGGQVERIVRAAPVPVLVARSSAAGPGPEARARLDGSAVRG